MSGGNCLVGPVVREQDGCLRGEGSCGALQFIQSSATLVAVAATIAALVNKVACAPISEHSSRKVSIAFAAAAAELCRHLAMTA